MSNKGLRANTQVGNNKGADVTGTNLPGNKHGLDVVSQGGSLIPEPYDRRDISWNDCQVDFIRYYLDGAAFAEVQFTYNTAGQITKIERVDL